MVLQIKKLLAPPIFNDELKTRAAYILNIVVLTMLTAVLALSVVYVFILSSNPTSLRTLLIVTSTLITGLVILFLLMRRGYVNSASIGLIILFLGIAYYLLPEEPADVSAIIATSPIIILTLPIIMAALLLGARAGLLTALASSLILMSAFFRIPGNSFELLRNSYPLYVAIYFAMALLLRVATQSIAGALSEARQSNAALQEANAHMESRVVERTRDLALAAEIGRTLSQARDVEEVLQLAVESVQSHFDLYYTQIYLVDAEEQQLVLRAGAGSVGRELLSRKHQLPLNTGSISGTAVVNRNTVIVPDTKTSALFRPNSLLPNTRSEMAVPLLVGPKAVGVLDLQSARPNALSVDNLPAFEALAGQLAVAIENARLIRDSNRARAALEARARQNTRESWDNYLNAIQRNERVGYLYQEGETMALAPATAVAGQATTLPIAIAGEVIGSVTVHEDAPAGLSKESLDLVSAVAHQISQQIENLRLLDEAEQYRQEAEESAHRLIREGWEEVQKTHKGVGFYYDHIAVQPLAATSGSESGMIQAPLSVQGEPIGKLELSGIQGDNVEARRFLTAVAARLSAHLENLRLTAQTEEALDQSRLRSAELDILNEMGKALTAAVDEGEIIRHVYHYVSQLMDSTNLYVALYDREADEVQINLFYGNEEARPGDIHSVIRRQSGNGVTEYVLRAGQPLLVRGSLEAVAEKLGFEAFGRPSEVWLGVPMMLGDEAIGVIAVQSFTDPDLYQEHHEDLLTAVASQVAIAIQNTRLLTQTQARARHEQILREVTARVHTAVNAQSVLRTAAQEINRVMGLEAFVYLEDQVETEAAVNGDNGHG